MLALLDKAKSTFNFDTKTVEKSQDLISPFHHSHWQTTSTGRNEKISSRPMSSLYVDDADEEEEDEEEIDVENGEENDSQGPHYGNHQ